MTREEELEHVKKTLENLNKMIEGQAEDGIKSIEIHTDSGKRKIDRTALLELIKARDIYLKRLKELEGKKLPRQLLIRF